MNPITLGILGGSGLYQMKEMSDIEEIKIDTPFGPPSDNIIVGTLSKKRVAFLPRHGRGHRYSPSDINYRANIFAFKKIGVSQIISASAVGSLKLEHKPLDIVIPDQFVDRTTRRASTFFSDGIVAHVGFGDPVCRELSGIVRQAAVNAGVSVKFGGTYLNMEGPAFSTKAESNLYRSWGMDIIGMTNIQEAKLAREAEICYLTMAFVTDYDCWHQVEESVTVDMILDNLRKNVENAQKILKEVAKLVPEKRDCTCHHALQNAIVTSPESVPAALKEKLAPIIGRYVGLK